jgi:hypothetical protein
VQVAVPGLGAMVPLEQLKQTEPSFENLPLGQTWQKVVLSEKDPAGQRVHEPEPALVAMEPFGHRVQFGDPSSENLPTGQMRQVVLFVEKNPAAHGVQVPEPTVLETVPLGQVVQFATLRSAKVPMGHGRQTVLLLLAKYPSSQNMHSEEGELAETDLGGHAIHEFVLRLA